MKYIIKRILLLIPVLIGLSLFVFTILALAPGDPAEMILGSDATELEIQAKRIELGLDKPLMQRYLTYVAGIVTRGDFGTSWFSGYNVVEEFIKRVPNTIILGFASMVVSAVIGIPLGILAAVNQYSVFDYGTLVFAMIFSSVPAFWLGLMAQVFICLKLGLLPATGADTAKHFILPTIALSMQHLAGQIRMTRTAMLEVMKQDYVRTARAKGCSESRIITVHVIRNGLLPVITGLGGSFSRLLGGAVIAETVFGIPGTGSLMTNAVRMRDVPVVMGNIIIQASFIGVVNLIVDLLYTVIDPRVKLEG